MVETIVKLSALSCGIAAICVAGLTLSADAEPFRFCDIELLSRLNITPEQQAQLDEFKENRFNRMQAVLTSEQQGISQEAKAARETARELFCQLDLTDAQKQEMSAIRQEGRQEFLSILTPEQQVQLEELRARRRGRHSFNRGVQGVVPSGQEQSLNRTE